MLSLTFLLGGLLATASAATAAAATDTAPPLPCSIHGRVVDAAGQPVPQARVELVDAGVAAVVTDRAGRYCVPPLAQPRDTAAGPAQPGAGAVRQIRLLVTAEGYQDQLSELELTGAQGLELAGGQVDVTLTRRFVQEITVTGRADSLVGVSASASEGSVGLAELKTRPLLRSTDIMEAVPGVAMTQHSTGGHAPIILLRGYNLDHGTDFATFLQGVPLNLPSHAHAQGYTDTNFLISELIGRIDFQKGPYAASVGDFSTAGAADIELPDTLARPFATVETGPYDFYHGVAGASIARGGSRWLFGLEANHYNGPSVVPDDFNRIKGVVRYSAGDAQRGHDVSFFTYGAGWNATDGYPARAVTEGYITRFGTLDSTDGGNTQRHMVIGQWHAASGNTLTRLTAYTQYYDFDLFSNLTFWTRDPQLGDQIEQSDRRVTSGALATQTRTYSWHGRSVTLTGGLQARNDLIRLRAFNTYQRTPTDKHDDAGNVIPAQVYDNHVTETSVSPYVETRVHWTPWLRTVAGLRGDLFYTRVDSDTAANSGSETSGVASPKVGVVFGPWAQTEFYANAGNGFHSNHANGLVQRVDPTTGTPYRADGRLVTPTAPVVRTRGAELGVRTLAIANLQSSASLWIIDSDSELVYAPEDGFTEPERPGRRYGLEWNNFYRARRWLALDLDAAWSRARYRVDPNNEGRYIPDAIQGVVSAGVAVSELGRVSGSLRGRYLGRRALVSDGSAFSRPAFVMNGQLDIRLTDRCDLGLDLFNVLDRRYDDITYYFATRIRDPRPGGALEPTEQADYVTHPGEPRTARVRLRLRF